MIENRRIKLSKNKNIFDDNICTSKNALDKSNFKHKLTYTGDFDKRKNKIKKNNLINFNTQFCESVKKIVEKRFFGLINKHLKKTTV